MKSFLNKVYKMKKSIVLIAFLFCATLSTFALETNLECSVNTPLDIGLIHYPEDNDKQNSGDASQGGILLGGNIGLDLMFTDVVGLGVNLGVYGTPLYIKPTVKQSKNFQDFTATFTNAAIVSSTFTVGPIFRVGTFNNMELSFMPCIEVDYFNINDTSKYNIIDYGLGVDTQLSFHINPLIAFNLGFYNGFTFLQSVIHNGVSSNTMFNYRFSPRCGVNFNL